jgi:hypothetical protein
MSWIARLAPWRNAAAAGLLAGLVLATGQRGAAADPAAVSPAPTVAPSPAKDQAPAEFLLAYKFEAGQQVHFLLETDSKIDVQKSGFAQTNHNNTTTERHFRVLSTNSDGSAQLELTIDRVKLSYSFDDSPPTVYDTGAADLPPKGFERVRDSVGRPLGQMKMSRDGKLLDLTSLHSPQDQLRKKIDLVLQICLNRKLDDFPKSVSDLVGLSRPNQPVDESQNFLVVFPDRPVHVGESWYDDIHARLSFSRTLTQQITLRRTYTLHSVNGNLATIRMATAEITPVTDPMLRGQMLQLTPEGQIMFDMEKGMIVAREHGVDSAAPDALGPGTVMRAKSSFNEKLVAK